MSGCVVRVYDLYDEALQDYVQALGKLHANLDKMGVPEDQWPADIRCKASGRGPQRLRAV